jgi:hypothetical protein
LNFKIETAASCNLSRKARVIDIIICLKITTGVEVREITHSIDDTEIVNIVIGVDRDCRLTAVCVLRDAILG